MRTKYPRRTKRSIKGRVYAIKPPDDITSRKMSRVRRERTEIETIFAKGLRGAGIRYRSGKRLVGKPDFVVLGQRIAIFCDGDFWHGYKFDGKKIRRNRGFWRAKIQRNIERDKEVNALLTGKGWKIIRFWEHDIKKDINRCIRRLRRAMPVEDDI